MRFAVAAEEGTAAAVAVADWYINGGLDEGLGVLGRPTSDSGGLSTGSAGEDLMIGTMCFIMPLLLLLPLPALALLGGTSSCDEDDDDDRKVRL